MKQGIGFPYVLTALALGAALPAPTILLAQGSSLEYTEVTRVEAPGVIGVLLSRSAGGEATRGVHVLDAKLRTDDGSTSTIFDGAEREWIFLDHDSRTYMKFSLNDLQEITGELIASMREAREELGPELEEMRAEMEAARAEMEEAQQTIDFTIEYVATGDTDRIQGYASARHQIVVRMEEADGVEGAQEVEGGSLVVLVDLWVSEELARADPLSFSGSTGDNPFYDALMEDPAFRELAEELSASFESGEAGGDLAAFAIVDPRVGAAMGEALERLSELEGMPVRTTTVVAVLPPAVDLDPALLLAWEPESMGAQIRGEASGAARDAARDAAAGAVRGLTRGVFGGGRDPDPEPEVAEEDLIIRPLFRVTSEITDVRAGGTPSADLFAIPLGYAEYSVPMSVGGPGAR